MQEANPWIAKKYDSFKLFLNVQMPYIVLIATLLIFAIVFFFESYRYFYLLRSSWCSLAEVW